MVTESALPGEPPPTGTLCFHDRRTTIGIRTARYSLIVNRSGPDKLYDLLVDPLQNHNAYPHRSYRPVRRALLEVGAKCATVAAPSAESLSRTS